MAVQTTRLPFYLAAFGEYGTRCHFGGSQAVIKKKQRILMLTKAGAILLVVTLFHQFDGVPESWKASFSSTKQDGPTLKRYENRTHSHKDIHQLQCSHKFRFELSLVLRHCIISRYRQSYKTPLPPHVSGTYACISDIISSHTSGRNICRRIEASI